MNDRGKKIKTVDYSAWTLRKKARVPATRPGFDFKSKKDYTRKQKHKNDNEAG